MHACIDVGTKEVDEAAGGDENAVKAAPVLSSDVGDKAEAEAEAEAEPEAEPAVTEQPQSEDEPPKVEPEGGEAPTQEPVVEEIIVPAKAIPLEGDKVVPVGAPSEPVTGEPPVVVAVITAEPESAPEGAEGRGVSDECWHHYSCATGYSYCTHGPCMTGYSYCTHCPCMAGYSYCTHGTCVTGYSYCTHGTCVTGYSYLTHGACATGCYTATVLMVHHV